MRALVHDGRTTTLERSHPVPVPASGEALIRTVRAAVSAADVAAGQGRTPYSGTLGHEFVGVVESVADGGDRSWTGRRVVASIVASCERCDLCQRGLRRHCRERTVLGVQGRDGCLADRFTLPTANLAAVPDSVDDDHALFVHPLATAIQASRQFAVEGQPYITVLGDGPAALLAGQVMARLNASVRVVGDDAGRLELCEKWRLQHRLAVDVGRRADQDVVVETTGSADGLALALQLVRPRGTIVLAAEVGAGAPGPEGIDLAPVVLGEITLVGSYAGPVGEAITLLERREVDVVSLIGRRMKLEDGERLLVAAASPGALKVLVDL